MVKKTENYKNNLLLNFLVLIVVMLIIFIIFELLVRIFFPITDTLYTGDDFIGYKHIPNKEGWNIIEERKTKVKFNSEGFRDNEHSVKNYNDSLRVVFLGDSFVDSLQVDFNKVFHQLISKEINQNGGNIETFNFGIPAFSTAQEYLTYENYAKKYNSDITYLFFFTNDPSDNCGDDSLKPTYFIEEGQIKMREFSPRKYNSFEIFISNHFKSLVFLRSLYYKFKNKNVVNKDMNDGILDLNKVFLKGYDANTEECWNITFYFIDKLQKEIEGNGGKFKIVIISNPASVYESNKERLLEKDTTFDEDVFDFDKPYNVLMDFLEGKNIEYINLIDFFKNYQERLYLEKDGHWNEKGHEVVAEIVIKNIEHSFLK